MRGEGGGGGVVRTYALAILKTASRGRYSHGLSGLFHFANARAKCEGKGLPFGMELMGADDATLYAAALTPAPVIQTVWWEGVILQ
jgi:hypothetical protein